MKKFNIIWLLFSFVLLFSVSFAQVEFKANYSSERFQPSDKFHAGCENQLDVVFSLNYSNIVGVNAVLEYDSSQVEILKILVNGEKEHNLSYVIEWNKIIFNKLKSQDSGLDKVVFNMFFKVPETLESTYFNFATGSYVLDTKWNMVELNKSYEFLFAAVPECEPDIIAPTVELLFPKITDGSYVALDSYFQFNIYDLGKGINKDRIQLTIDSMRYDMSNIEHERSGDVLTVYPDVWLPLGADVEMDILVQDKQVYGKPNITSKTYNFKTSTGLYLLNEIDPVQFRKLVNKEKYYQWSTAECDFLKNTYSTVDSETKDIISSINKRLSCPDLTGLNDLDESKNILQEENLKWPSVFSVLWWIMLVLLSFMFVFRWLSKK